MVQEHAICLETCKEHLVKANTQVVLCLLKDATLKL